jgi:hypothetical protein
MTVFGNDLPYYENEKEFTEGDLLNRRRKAIDYYNSQLEAFSNKASFHGREFIRPDEGTDFDELTTYTRAGFSVSLALIEHYPNGEYENVEHWIAGQDDESVQEGRDIEHAVFAEMGIEIEYNDFLTH